jgi:hypothetical protein
VTDRAGRGRARQEERRQTASEAPQGSGVTMLPLLVGAVVGGLQRTGVGRTAADRPGGVAGLEFQSHLRMGAAERRQQVRQNRLTGGHRGEDAQGAAETAARRPVLAVLLPQGERLSRVLFEISL